MQPDQTPNILPTSNPESPAVPERQPAPAVPELQPAPPASAPLAPVAPRLPVAVPVPDPQLAVAPTPVAAPPASTPASPALADDVDVIEKEWVDAADKVVRQTSTDPYAEEEAVESLQVDYLKKRYGHDVKKTESS